MDDSTEIGSKCDILLCNVSVISETRVFMKLNAPCFKGFKSRSKL